MSTGANREEAVATLRLTSCDCLLKTHLYRASSTLPDAYLWRGKASSRRLTKMT